MSCFMCPLHRRGGGTSKSCLATELPAKKRLGLAGITVHSGRSSVLLRTHDFRQIRRLVLGRWRHQEWRATLLCYAACRRMPTFFSRSHTVEMTPASNGRLPGDHSVRKPRQRLGLTKEGHVDGRCRSARLDTSERGGRSFAYRCSNPIIPFIGPMQLVLFLILPKPCAQTLPSNHLIAHPERGRQPWAKERNSLHPPSAILTNCMALWGAQFRRKNEKTKISIKEAKMAR